MQLLFINITEYKIYISKYLYKTHALRCFLIHSRTDKWQWFQRGLSSAHWFQHVPSRVLWHERRSGMWQNPKRRGGEWGRGYILKNNGGRHPSRVMHEDSPYFYGSSKGPIVQTRALHYNTSIALNITLSLAVNVLNIAKAGFISVEISV